MTSTSLQSAWKKTGWVACLAIFLTFFSLLSFGQQLTGTLSGTTTDTTGAVVPNAKVTMTNQLNGDVRTTVSNANGYFSITAIQPGTYTVAIEAQGFKQWKQEGVVFNQGDNRNLPQIALQVGAVNETVEISAGALAVPTDNAEISTTVPENMVDAFPMGNRDAGELLKIMPGMAFANGASQGSGFSDKVVSSASGPVGSFSSNGTQPSGAMAFMLDGANLVDPGNAGSQVANINQDMVSEVKVLMSDYSAEYAKGPVIFQAFSKSGGSHYHGEVYTYARNSALNGIDAYTHSQIVSGATSAAIAAPAESFYYMGGNFGGPVPGLEKGRQKLFFWGGYEYMRQHPAGSIINYNTPTTEQLQGDFSNTTIDGVPGTTPVNGTTLTQQLQNVWGYAYNTPCCNGFGGATSILPSSWDPNGKIFASLLPKPNLTPTGGNGWSNYQYVQHVPQNRWEATGKLDYAIGDNTKLTGSYTRQIETDQHPVGIWWTPPWTLPYPSSVDQNLNSQLVMANFTHVFNPTTTNELVFTYARFNAPNVLTNEKAVDRQALGMSIQGLFGVTTKQIPNVEGPWGGVFPDIAEMNLTGPFDGSGFGAEKEDPSIYDNYTKVIGSHTLKFGAYWDTNKNIQSSSAFGTGANGTYNLGWGGNSTGNVVADFFLGRANNYQQPSGDIVNTIQDHQWSIYAQDSYKANRQLTVNYGLRFDHVGQWYGGNHGMAIWDGATYVNGTPTSPDTVANTGLQWHGINSGIPISGWSSPLFYYEPRVGIAYDVFGTGKTVIRGGFASFRYQVSVNDVGGANNLASGIYTTTDYTIETGYNQIGTFAPPPSGGANGSTIAVMQQGDNRTPYTNDWNISVAQALPWRSVFEISYVGNQSRNELINGANGKLDDLNSNYPGAYWLSDPTTAPLSGGVPVYQPNGTPLYVSPSPLPCAGSGSSAGSNYINCNAMGPNQEPLCANYDGCAPVVGPTGIVAFNENDYRRLTNYQDIYLQTHGSYANYNSLQMSWKKQSGPISYLLNYTFGKVMGIRDGNTNQNGTNGPVVDPFNLANNYGPLAYDHSQILNATYVWNLPSPIHGNRVIEGAVNGWQLSGYTTYQSGANLQAANIIATTFGGGNGSLTVPVVGLSTPYQGTNYNYPDESILMPNGLRSTAVNQATYYGTSQNGGGYASMLPLVTCDPRKHASGQYFNPNCFTTPAQGQLGTFVWPYLHAPAYFDSDLGLYKSFKISESKQLQFRIQATNFLNHPLPQFGLAGTLDETMDLYQNTPYSFPYLAVSPQPAPTGSQTQQQASCAYVGATADPNNGSSCDYTIHSMATTNTSTSMTGKPQFKTGQRVVTFAVKFYF
jgi:Carboxypeptidase regulatory-like domain/TonB-dependent Receptor Plug Domain